MDYEIEFERLLDFAKQALSGVSIKNREVIGFAGLAVLDDVVRDYENRLAKQPGMCSYSPDKVHHFDGDAVQVCSYCTSRQKDYSNDDSEAKYLSD